MRFGLASSTVQNAKVLDESVARRRADEEADEEAVRLSGKTDDEVPDLPKADGGTDS
ncbi:hypothetical protein ACFWWT_40435 [Streptomyces sp. NPDC058676]|uniref:hypothetical protein n=1 Tax=unclassified Streptomyces TaxID=2593676 RepID=UPI00365A7A46